MSTALKVAVAMSGGVDSAVAASLLVDQGVDAFGLMMRLWAEDGRVNRCCSPADVAAARQVAADLKIPFYVLDMREPFREHVVQFFLDGYAQGVTPNPCVECNRTIRWTLLLSEAIALGATHLATGHYARVRNGHGTWTLLRGGDRDKDQSYVLSVLTQDQLARARFPLGDLTKSQVRAYARSRNLPVAERPESQDLCFLAGQDYRQFLLRNAGTPPRPGPILDPEGNELGRHDGLELYTIGQRRGLRVPSTEPLFVIEKDAAANALVVGPRHRLGRSSFTTHRTTWIGGAPPAPGRPAQVQVRYRSAEVGCRVTAAANGTARVALDRPAVPVSPGQSAVFYDGEVCLGSGIIAR